MEPNQETGIEAWLLREARRNGVPMPEDFARFWTPVFRRCFERRLKEIDNGAE